MSTAAVAGIEKSERPQRNNLMMHCKALGWGKGRKAQIYKQKTTIKSEAEVNEVFKSKNCKESTKQRVSSVRS